MSVRRDGRIIECQVIFWGSDEGEVLLGPPTVVVFVFFKELGETLQVDPVQAVDVLAAGTGRLDHRDGPPH